MIDKFKGEYGWLSNFWPAPVRLDGIEFPTVEHAYQAGKVLSHEIRERIRTLPTPADAKRFGKRLGKSIPYRPAWSETFKVALMRYLLWQKFTRPDLRQRLLLTGHEELVEGGHWHDCFFGCCRCSKCGGKGMNWLGILLMEIRAELRAKETSMAGDERRLADAA
ncbi:MAG: NADAR family protein [Verrucomicrobiia bacterium]